MWMSASLLNHEIHESHENHETLNILSCISCFSCISCLSRPRDELTHNVRQDAAVTECHELLWRIDTDHGGKLLHRAVGRHRAQAHLAARRQASAHSKDAERFSAGHPERGRAVPVLEL